MPTPQLGQSLPAVTGSSGSSVPGAQWANAETAMALSHHGNFHSKDPPPRAGRRSGHTRTGVPSPLQPPPHQERSRQASRTNGPGQPIGTGPSPPASVAHRAFPRRRGGPSLLPPAGMLCCHMFIWDKRAWSARTSYEQTSDGAKVEARAGGPDLLEPATLGEEPRCSAGGHQAPTWPPTTAGLSGCRAQPAFPSSRRRVRLERTPCGWGSSSFCCLPRAAQIQIHRSQGEAMTLKHP